MSPCFPFDCCLQTKVHQTLLIFYLSSTALTSTSTGRVNDIGGIYVAFYMLILKADNMDKSKYKCRVNKKNIECCYYCRKKGHEITVINKKGKR